MTSGEDGTYTFSNLVPGTYEVDDPILVTLTTQVHIVVNVPALSPNIISGMKFNDQNGNGVKDAGELGIANWGIDLAYVVPGPDILMAQVNTDSNGAYKFINVPHGNYKIRSWPTGLDCNHTHRSLRSYAGQFKQPKLRQ